MSEETPDFCLAAWRRGQTKRPNLVEVHLPFTVGSL